MADAILALNAGSSSIKFALFEVARDTLSIASRGQMEGIGTTPHFFAKDPSGKTLIEQRWPDGGGPTHETMLRTLVDWVDKHLGSDRLIAVGHRVVHGGATYDRSVLVSDQLIAALEQLTRLAPLHQKHSLEPMRAIASLRPGLRQVACFDTSFHHSMAPVATRLALPHEIADFGVRRYGFHGLSYEYIARHLRETEPDLAAGRVIVAHLGNGASLCAMRDGRSVDTTMGFTALDGLVMGTRCGTLDPGVILYLMQARGMTAAQIEDLLYRRSGLLGLSGISSDMRALQASHEERAREAIDSFVFRIAREAGGLISSLGGLDGLVFTAGIGEHTPTIRAAVCERLTWIGAALDDTGNAAGGPVISTADSRVALRVIPTDEEAMIARHTLEAIGATAETDAGDGRR